MRNLFCSLVSSHPCHRALLLETPITSASASIQLCHCLCCHRLASATCVVIFVFDLRSCVFCSRDFSSFGKPLSAVVVPTRWHYTVLFGLEILCTAVALRSLSQSALYAVCTWCIQYVLAVLNLHCAQSCRAQCIVSRCHSLYSIHLQLTHENHELAHSSPCY